MSTSDATVRDAGATGAEAALAASARPRFLSPIVPQATISARALVAVVAIMTFLASLTMGAAVLVRTVANDWQSEVAREVTIQIRPAGGRDLEADIVRAAALIRDVPAGFSIYSGNDDSAIALMLLGGHGNVSVTANVAPRLMADLCKAALEGRAKDASALHLKLLALHKNLFCEPSPAPTKWAMARLGLCGEALRLPITPLTSAGQALVGQAMREAGLA